MRKGLEGSFEVTFLDPSHLPTLVTGLEVIFTDRSHSRSVRGIGGHHTMVVLPFDGVKSTVEFIHRFCPKR
jgi:hypothetical protein